MRGTILTTLAALVAAAPAQAISRYNSETLSCQRVQAVLQQEGAAIFRYASKRNPSLTLYDRYVLHGGYCGWDEYAANAWVPTRNEPRCFVRKCRPKVFEDDHF